ncbi:hypothetical protein RHMOL_Rhmol13G0225400 [Rhododendron molle]|uniref:Uncharacterized protein n=1 Tax=Rhododendron molle TaxID=49168 RepID=A0ACC0L9J4_RHOML|nr:hypothetical protein RHMOL_Rhmol13G0225400 [Rhododendron molle]
MGTDRADTSLSPSHRSLPSPPRLEVPIRLAQVWTSFCNGFFCKVGNVRICIEETHWNASHFGRCRDGEIGTTLI